jgi:hypothetical protein
MVFYLPLAVMISASIIYRNDLGNKAILVYWGLWLAGHLACRHLPIPSYGFIAYQALLSAAMLIHAKKAA